MGESTLDSSGILIAAYERCCRLIQPDEDVAFLVNRLSRFI
jgi:hypothetical protein